MVKRRWPSSPLARSLARAVARRTRTVARPRGTLPVSVAPVSSRQAKPSRASPSFTELDRVARGRAGPACPRESPRHRRVSDERARIQALGTERERKRASEEEGGTETERKRKRRGRETERLPPPPLSGLPRVRLSVAPSDQEDGPTGGRLSGPSTRGASTGRPTTTTTTTTKTKTSLAETVVC